MLQMDQGIKINEIYLSPNPVSPTTQETVTLTK